MRLLTYAVRCLLVLLAVSPAAAVAATGGKGGPELTLTAGIRHGRAAFPIEARGPLIVCVTTPCVLAEARTEDGEVTHSLILDVPVSRRWMVEALLTELDGDLRLRSSFAPNDLEPETFESTTFQVGLLRRWGEGRVSPFAAGAVGATRFETGAAAYERPLFPGAIARPVREEVPSGSLAGGVKVELGPRLALRLEARAYWHDLASRLGGALEQGEASVGLAYRW